MARAYTLATAALALSVRPKWLDNILSHHKVAGVVQERQGVARRITIDGLVQLLLIQIFVSEAGVTLNSAVRLAQKASEAGGRVELTAGIHLIADLEALRSTLVERLEHAVEIAPLPRRGRPPKNTTGRLD